MTTSPRQSETMPTNDYECADLCVHGKSFDVICVECCPEDDDGSFTGDDWTPLGNANDRRNDKRIYHTEP